MSAPQLRLPARVHADDETTPLLPASTGPGHHHDDGDDGGEQTPPSTALQAWTAELVVLLQSSVPIIVAYTLQTSLSAVSILIAGRLSSHALATAAFAYMFAMSTAWLIALGGTTAIDTLASASFTGSKDPHDLGVILQRAFFLLFLFYVPVLAIWAAAEPLFLALGQDPALAHDAARFLWVLAPGGLGYIYFEAMKKYLQAQGIYRPGTYVLLITAPLNVLLNWLCVYPLRLGLLGAPLATSISYWLSFILLVLYARFVQGGAAWGGWSRAALRNLGTFSRLALLGILAIGTEWWAFEIVALVAGHLGEIPLAAQSVIMTTDQVIYTIPFGLGVACSARVGNLLGARDAAGARRAAHVAALLSLVFALGAMAFWLGVKDWYARIFNDDERVVRLTAQVLPFVAAFQPGDGINASASGALRGQGRQHIGALINTVSYYAGALPLGIWLAYHGWGLVGLWLGQCIALSACGVVEWTIVAASEWDQEVVKAAQRIENHAGDGVEGPVV